MMITHKKDVLRAPSEKVVITGYLALRWGSLASERGKI